MKKLATLVCWGPGSGWQGRGAQSSEGDLGRLSQEGMLRNMFFFLRFYLFIHERQREREAETQAKEEAGSMQGAPRRT